MGRKDEAEVGDQVMEGYAELWDVMVLVGSSIVARVLDAALAFI